MKPFRLLPDLIRSLFSNRRGNVTILAAGILPILLFGAMGGIDVITAMIAKQKMKAVADSAAISGAQQLLMDASSTTSERAQSFATAQLGTLGEWHPSVTAEVINQSTALQVTISGMRPGFFGALLFGDGWKVSVSSIASLEGKVPLCLLVTGTSARSVGLGGKEPVAKLKDHALVTAPQCMVHSNETLSVQDAAQVNAGRVEAVAGVTGYTSPPGYSGARMIEDPFANLSVSSPSNCASRDPPLNYQGTALQTGNYTLEPGVHCGDINVGGNVVLTLAAGEHYFVNVKLHITGSAKMQGTDVVLIFSKNSQFQFDWNSDIELEGRTSGNFAGFVIVATRSNNNAFTIATTAARKLLGVVYVPYGVLDVQGQSRVAQDSAWTIIVCKGMLINQFANLVLNTNYAASYVPVPTGVGPNGKAALTQ